MNQILTLFTLLAFNLAITSASDEYEAVLDTIKQGYQDSLNKLSDEQRNGLRQFKLILSKTSKVEVDNPLTPIPDEVLAKKVVKYLEQKLGSYPTGLEQEHKFLSDCDKYLAEPCENLRSSFKLSMAFYYARFGDKNFVNLVKSDRDSYDQLETAGVCETLLKATDKICAKSFNYMVNHKSAGVFKFNPFRKNNNQGNLKKFPGFLQ